jgi:hypothetical protein
MAFRKAGFDSKEGTKKTGGSFIAAIKFKDYAIARKYCSLLWQRIIPVSQYFLMRHFFMKYLDTRSVYVL